MALAEVCLLDRARMGTFQIDLHLMDKDLHVMDKNAVLALGYSFL